MAQAVAEGANFSICMPCWHDSTHQALRGALDYDTLGHTPTVAPPKTPTQVVQVRYANYADMAAIAALNTAVWQESSTSVACDDAELAAETAATLDRLKRGLTRRMLHSGPHRAGGRIVVAQIAQELIAVARCGPAKCDSSPRDLELHSIRLRQNYHGTGIADAVLELTLGQQSCCLWVGRENHRAQGFYRKHGFTMWSPDSSESDLLCMVR